MSNIKPDLSIEYGFIRVPYDSAVRGIFLNFLYIIVFKTSKKTIEKEMSSILNSIIALKKEKSLTKTGTTDSLKTLITRLQTLKRRLDENYKEEDKIYDCCKKRLVHLNSVDPKDKQSLDTYQAVRLHRLIVDHLSRNGCYETANMIAKEYQIEVSPSPF